MDTYFCYIHRDTKAVAELKILTCETEAGLESQLAGLKADYPGARFEIFQGDRQVTRFSACGQP
jgi:hypothetical protein